MTTLRPTLAQCPCSRSIPGWLPADWRWKRAAAVWLCMVPALASCVDAPTQDAAETACGPTKDGAAEAWTADLGASAGDAAAVEVGAGDSGPVDVDSADGSAAGDADGAGGPAEVSSTVANAAPSAPSVGLTTDAADLNSVTLGSKLTCSVTTASVDAEGDAITYQYQWYVNTVADGASIGAATLVANLKFQGAEIKKGATIQCKVFASDGTTSSLPGHSAEVTVIAFDACATKLNSCGAHATCTNTDTLAVLCACNPGYAGDGTTCLDVDECADGSAKCAAAAICANTDGSYTCTCKPGYAGEGTACADVDECLTLNGGCGDAKLITCQNVVAGPVTCADINECATGNGGCGDVKSFVCNNNYAKVPTCGVINSCAGGNGGCGDVNYWTCKENIGAPLTCTDIDECALNNGGCGGVKYNSCINKVGAPPVCADIDECKLDNGGCGSATFHSCKNNLNLAPTCTDINECAGNNGGCGSAKFYTCSNNVGGAPACADIDECKVNNGGCGTGICVNHVGTAATCTCSVAKGPALVNLGTAANFAALAKTGISSVATSILTGDIGVSPAAASFITGFALTTDVSKVFAKSAQVSGKVYAADYSPPTPANLTAAISHMEAAYTDAAGRPAPEFVGLGAGNIGGKTLAPGLYKWSSNLTIPNDVVLSGCPNDVWIFQVTGNITMTAAKTITLTGGAQAKNVFWQSAGLVSIGAGAHFEGSILSKTSITLQTSATLNGRVLAQTLVALQKATVKL